MTSFRLSAHMSCLHPRIACFPVITLFTPQEYPVQEIFHWRLCEYNDHYFENERLNMQLKKMCFKVKKLENLSSNIYIYLYIPWWGNPYTTVCFFFFILFTNMFLKCQIHTKLILHENGRTKTNKKDWGQSCTNPHYNSFVYIKISLKAFFFKLVI